jgi:hypothetical protein
MLFLLRPSLVWPLALDAFSILAIALCVGTLSTGLLFLLLLFSPVATISSVQGYTAIDGRVASQEDAASLAGYLSFAWVNSLLDKGETKPLEEEDLPDLSDRDQMATVVGNWEAYQNPATYVFA